MVFATCDSTSRSTGIGSDCILNIAYNVQIPLCQSTTTPDVVNNIRVCRPLANLCMRDPSAHFDFDQSDGHDVRATSTLIGRLLITGLQAFQQIPFSSILPESSDLLVFDTTFSPTPLPLPLRTGDFNLDGFPDLLFIRALSRNAEHTPTLLMNVACGTSGSSKCEKGGRRAWKVVKQGAEPFEKVKDARGVAFIDIDEDGTLDFMVQRTGKDGQGKISFVQNNFYHDAFFLKAIGEN
jgi:integrin alpha FG-GAP repeat containing protein 1